MKWTVLLILTIVSFVSADLTYLVKSTGPDLYGAAQGFETVNTDYSQDYQRSSQVLDDSLDEDVPIGFSFPFNGSSFSEIIISSNGVLYFRTSGHFDNNTERSNAAYYVDQHLSDTTYALENGLFPYWDDLNPNSGGSIKYGTIGSGDGEHFVVSWKDVPHYNNSGSYSFQVALYKDGTIIFRYDRDSDANGDSNGGATIGVKEDNSNYDEHSYRSHINQNRDVVYRTYRHLTPIVPVCSPLINQIVMNTYQNASSHPRDTYVFLTLRQNNTTLIGGGYQDQINGSGDPYGDNDYYWSDFQGYLYMPDSGVYRIGVDGDDAVEVYLDDQLITGWYGGHGRQNHEEYVLNVDVQAGWHKINFHQEERSGGDNYYLYWQRPGGSMEIIPSSRFFHCAPEISKSSCVINDPVNNTTDPKRIPGATIRYAIELKNNTPAYLSNAIVEDNIINEFDESTITNLKIDGSNACNCLSPVAASTNGANGSANGVNPVKLDFDTVAADATECGYFEVKIK